ncbi:hypothetical protein SAMN05421780_101562 [Flexibacter flexilis DSM 6793]|uniref:Lipoprotein n=1 Tax=Flexibacter flexilis DSM 6793 TaxID=927664 RepID=A0A1I1E6U1_9BACT|nr:hypothetical protein [Flexibacter flexilis]SFB80643.1 hypothetical protein SAMN05421780_101562 [Flexibacter flexilis DSM 6793]
MKNVIILSLVALMATACGGNPEKDRATNLIKNNIGKSLPFDDVKIASVENGTGVIVDGSWCYWIDKDGNVFCVNGTSRGVWPKSKECVQAPIQSTFSDIEKIAK